jgi:hypothetical protein
VNAMLLNKVELIKLILRLQRAIRLQFYQW